jgi:ribonucleoside-diphosphate reductase beta chain
MLFNKQIARKPDLYPWASEFMDKMWDGFWTVRKFTFQGDYGQFVSELDDEEREVVTRTLSAIGQVEIAVKTFWARLGDHLPHPSIADLGAVFAHTEVIHNHAYIKLLERLGLTDIFDENLKVPAVKGRIAYLTKHNEKVYGDDRKQYVYSLILFSLFVENVSLFSQFYTILWFNRFKNVLKDTAQQVQYTRNEEMLHAQAGIKIINTLRAEYPDLFDVELEAKVIEETQVAFRAECDLIDWMIGDYERDGISADILKGYIKIRMNSSLAAIGFRKVFNVDERIYQTTYWMEEELFGNSHTDFFHKEPVEYSKNTQSFEDEDIF